ncbi:MAG: AzlC family ABC transporter permease [Candidatus Promineifilaceae bacterium]|nr:AzlC family ABC transporter permease [Candidatus Promineifilaceae bacterium]
MSNARKAFFAGVRAELPILLGVVPFGLIYGITALAAGIPPVLAQAMSWIVFAGSAQFVIAQLVAGGAPALIVVVTTFVVNLRHVLYSASVAPYVQPLAARWKRLLAYLLTDEAYAVVISRFREAPEGPGKRWFFLGAGLALWATWQASTAVGIFLGASVLASWPLDFALPLTFIALAVPAVRDGAAAAAAVTAGVVVIVAAGLPHRLDLLVAAGAGAAAGLAVEAMGIRPAPEPARGERAE